MCMCIDYRSRALLGKDLLRNSILNKLGTMHNMPHNEETQHVSIAKIAEKH